MSRMIQLVFLLLLAAAASMAEAHFPTPYDNSIISVNCNHSMPQLNSLSPECLTPLFALLTTETPIAGYNYRGKVIHRDVCHSFGHALCLEMLTEPECGNCLTFLAENVIGLCGMAVGAKVELPGCFLRYEEFEF